MLAVACKLKEVNALKEPYRDEINHMAAPQTLKIAVSDPFKPATLSGHVKTGQRM